MEELDSRSVESGVEGPVERLDSLEERLSLLEPLLLLEDATKNGLSQKLDVKFFLIKHGFNDLT